jgi:hypothetical protein
VSDAPSTPPDSDDAPVDRLGIPMSREPTIDDVRSDGVDHRRFAVGCSMAVSLALVLFWLIRGVLLR